MHVRICLCRFYFCAGVSFIECSLPLRSNVRLLDHCKNRNDYYQFRRLGKKNNNKHLHPTDNQMIEVGLESGASTNRYLFTFNTHNQSKCVKQKREKINGWRMRGCLFAASQCRNCTQLTSMVVNAFSYFY